MCFVGVFGVFMCNSGTDYFSISFFFLPPDFLDNFPPHSNEHLLQQVTEFELCIPTLPFLPFLGFSLVEVLAAVAIIGIITFLAMPNIIAVKQDSENNRNILNSLVLFYGKLSFSQVRFISIINFLK